MIELFVLQDSVY